MAKNLRWKVLTIVAVLALSIFAFYPPAQKMRLGLDLKGGVHLVLRVVTDDALRLETQTSADRLVEQLKTANIPVTANVVNATSFTVTVPPDQDAAFRASTALIELDPNYDRSSGAGTYTFTLKPNIVVNLREDTVNQALQTIERRVNELGVAEPLVAAPQRRRSDPRAAAGRHRRESRERNHPLHRAARAEAGRAGTVLGRSGGAPGVRQQPAARHADSSGTLEAAPGQPAGTGYYVVRRVPAVTGRDLRNARPTLDENNRPAVELLAQPGGRAEVRQLHASEHRPAAGDRPRQPRRLGAARSRSRIDDEGRITGNFTTQESQDLSLVLRSGALPANLTYLEERTVGPSLGADSIRAGVISAVGGLVLVTLFMLVYYKLAGFNALISIVVNLIILLGPDGVRGRRP